jgi:hypothetical protein
MSIWKWLIYATLFATNVSVIVMTWVSPEPPTKISLIIWVMIASIWIAFALVNDIIDGKK